MFAIDNRNTSEPFMTRLPYHALQTCTWDPYIFTHLTRIAWCRPNCGHAVHIRSCKIFCGLVSQTCHNPIGLGYLPKYQILTQSAIYNWENQSLPNTACKQHRPRSIGENPTQSPAVFWDGTFKNFMAMVFMIKLDRKKKTNWYLASSLHVKHVLNLQKSSWWCSVLGIGPICFESLGAIWRVIFRHLPMYYDTLFSSSCIMFNRPSYPGL